MRHILPFVIIVITMHTTLSAGLVELFPLDRVRLLDGPFREAQEVGRQYILAHDCDRLLAPIRIEAGLEPRAPKYGNWESTGLGGHSAGHYLSALAMMHAATGDAELKRRLQYMVNELAECQRANGNGYVGGVPRSKELWAEIAAAKIKAEPFALNGAWVPWYNLHKLFAGLRDAYLIGHVDEARDVLVALSDWCDGVTSNLSDEQMQEMLRSEHGGMNEVLADVAVITGDAKYLALARRFCHHEILEPLTAGQDELTGKHANTQIPKIVGFCRIAAIDGDDKLRRASVAFWENVVSRRTVIIGGNSVNEHFNPINDFRSMIEDRTGPETCNTYNMLRLSECLFQHDPQPRYSDFYERALFNHILASQHPLRGGYVYFTPMRPRHYRVYSQAEQAFWCCVGTGFENHGKYGRFIYAREGDDTLCVNLFIASELNWPEQGLKLRQETRFPDEPKTRLVFSLGAPRRFGLRVRHPEWAAPGGVKVSVNGEEQATTSRSSSYITLERQWHDGDVVELHLPMHVIVECLPDESDYVALRYGPVALAGIAGTDDMAGHFAGDGRHDHVAQGELLPIEDAPRIRGDLDRDQLVERVRRLDAERLEFTAADIIQSETHRDIKLIPFFRLHDSRYIIYWPKESK